MDIPCFISSDPTFWFSLVESIFESKNLTNFRDRFNAILLALPNHLQLEAKPFLSRFQQLTADDNDGKRLTYEELKKRIISITSVPEEQRLKELLDNVQIGTRTPSQFLNYLRNLQGDAGERDNKFLRSIFMRNLPTEIRNIIASHKYENLDDMATTADLIWQKPEPSITSVFDNQHLNSTKGNSEVFIQHILKMRTEHNEETKELRKALTDISKKLENLQSDFSHSINSLRTEIDYLKRSQKFVSPAHNSPFNTGAAGSSSRGEVNSNGWCYFHQKFGRSAFKCSQPCSFSHQQGN